MKDLGKENKRKHDMYNKANDSYRFALPPVRSALPLHTTALPAPPGPAARLINGPLPPRVTMASLCSRRSSPDGRAWPARTVYH